MSKKLNAISLFSSSGIGDLGLHANGINTVIANELLKDRASLFKENNPKTKLFQGDIWELQNNIIDYYEENFQGNPYIIMATPPCQGMSANGMGKMLNDYRKGLRPKYDERNRLIIPALNIIKELQPEWIIFENVANMVNTLIYDENDNLVNIIDYINSRLGENYVGGAEVVNFANYGIPQQRTRLITIYSKDKNAIDYYKKHGTYLPEETHSQEGDIFRKPWVTVRDVLGNQPRLEAVKGKNIDDANTLHKVPLLDDKKTTWVRNTKEGDTAFNNQCINPECGYQENTLHGARRNKKGINQSNKNTPLYCEKCGDLLPRPYVISKETGEKRLMRGFTSAYKRMWWDTPASTLTQNFQYACSDNKIHPEENRVLSLWEGLILQTIAEYDYKFVLNGKQVGDGLIRSTIGESVPPKMIDLICKNLMAIDSKRQVCKSDI